MKQDLYLYLKFQILFILEIKSIIKEKSNKFGLFKRLTQLSHIIHFLIFTLK